VKKSFQALEEDTCIGADGRGLPIRFISMFGKVTGLSTTANPKNAQLLRRLLGFDGSLKNEPMARRKTISDANR
jgi:hypothetical protein